MAVELIAKIKPKNNGNFPLVDAKDVAVDEAGTRLDEKLAELKEAAASAGRDGADGKDGVDGKTPVKGEDYFTEADKTELVNGVLAALPTWEGGSY